VDSAAREAAGAPAEQAAIRKISKYSVLSQSYLFQPLAVENTGVFSRSAVDSLNALAVASVHSAAKKAKVFFFSNAIHLPCNVSTPFFCTTVLFAMIRTSRHSRCF